MTSVVNVKVNNLRPKYKDLKEWHDDKNNVYIGRKGIVFIDGKRYPEHDSIWCNPYKIGKDGNRDQVLEKYKKYITDKLNDDDMKKQLCELKDKCLGCWCKPDKCHGDILLDLIKKSN